MPIGDAPNEIRDPVEIAVAHGRPIRALLPIRWRTDYRQCNGVALTQPHNRSYFLALLRDSNPCFRCEMWSESSAGLAVTGLESGVSRRPSLAFCTIAGLTAAKADVVRIAIVTADNQADFDKNNAMSETAKALLMKGNGVKAVYILADPAKLTVASVSVWPSEADIHSVTDSAEWKSSQRYLKFQDGGANRCVGYPRMVETRRVWRSE